VGQPLDQRVMHRQSADPRIENANGHGAALKDAHLGSNQKPLKAANPSSHPRPGGVFAALVAAIHP
jgi:hypothetical protein